MASYRVGHPYHPRVRQWPETAQLRITPDGTELAIFWARPTQPEIQAVRTGTAEFAWIDNDQVAVLAFRFGQQPWSDCPYHAGRDPQAGLPADLDDDKHLLVQVLLVDADTGLIAAMRQLTWPPQFTRKVAGTVDRMLATPYNEAAHDAALDTLYARYPHTESLVRSPAATICTGGQDG